MTTDARTYDGMAARRARMSDTTIDAPPHNWTPPAPPTDAPSAWTGVWPTVGEPGFWNLLLETIVVNLLDVVNIATVAPIVIAILTYLAGHTSGDTAIIITAILGIVNAVLQVIKANAGHGNNQNAWSRALARSTR